MAWWKKYGKRKDIYNITHHENNGRINRMYFGG